MPPPPAVLPIGRERGGQMTSTRTVSIIRTVCGLLRGVECQDPPSLLALVPQTYHIYRLLLHLSCLPCHLIHTTVILSLRSIHRPMDSNHLCTRATRCTHQVQRTLRMRHLATLVPQRMVRNYRMAGREWTIVLSSGTGLPHIPSLVRTLDCGIRIWIPISSTLRMAIWLLKHILRSTLARTSFGTS